MIINPSVVDYLGKYEGGILVSVGVMYNESYYDGIFYYTDSQMILTMEDKFAKELGMEIEQHDEYLDVLQKIIESVSPHEEVINELKEIKTIDF